MVPDLRDLKPPAWMEAASEEWPRVYRMGRSARRSHLAVAAVIAAVGLAALVVMPFTESAWGLALAIPLLGLSIPIARATRSYRLLLWPDAIEPHPVWGRRTRIARSDITGLRGHEGVLLFELKDGRRVRTSLYVDVDETLMRWLQELPYLDGIEAQQAIDAIVSDPRLGPTRESRYDAVLGARRVALVCSLASLALAGWALTHREPSPVVIPLLVAFPLVMLAVQVSGRGLYASDQKRGDPRPTLLPAMLGPAMVLALRGAFDGWLVDPAVFGLTACAIPAALTALLFAFPALSKREWAAAVGAGLLVGAPLGAGTTLVLNHVLDESPARQIEVEVLESVRVGTHQQVVLTLAPAGALTDGGVWRAPETLYDAVQPGDHICALVHEGALGGQWYTFAPRCGGR